MTDTYEKLYNILQDMGYMFFDEIEDDFAISDYIGDSFSFIEFIVNIETKFEIELSDDFLAYELLESARGLASKIDAYKLEISSIKADIIAEV